MRTKAQIIAEGKARKMENILGKAGCLTFSEVKNAIDYFYALPEGYRARMRKDDNGYWVVTYTKRREN